MSKLLPSERDALASDIYQACYLEGDFLLRSGERSKYYFDKYQFETDPKLLGRIATALVSIIPDGTEVLAGLEMGGLPIVTEVSRISGLPAAFVRKVKKEYGTARLAEGADLRNKQVAIVEDVVTSGGQIVLSSLEIRNIGAIIDHAICVIDRQQGGTQNLEEHKIRLISLFLAEELVREH